MVRFTATTRSGSTSRQLTLNVYCWLAEERLAGPQVSYERDIDFHTLKVTLLGDSGYALSGYEY